MKLNVGITRESIENLGGTVEGNARAKLMDAATIGYNWSVEQAPEDRGTLKQSSVAPTWDGDVIKWGYTQPYATAQEFGTEPYWPPAKPLVEWAERTFGDPSIGYQVQQKIAREGITPKRFAQAGVERQRRALDGESWDDLVEE